MKIKLKRGEHIRIETDCNVPVNVYIERGLVHVRAQEPLEPVRVFVADKRAKVERVK